MISFKTSVLVAAAMKMGALIAEAEEEDTYKIYDFGLNLGIAFQLQDDYLDTFGTTELFGKKIGGDIEENKKTFLFLKALEVGQETEKKRLLELYSLSEQVPNKVSEVTQIFKNNNISEIITEEIEKYTLKALEILNELSLDEEKKANLKNFGLSLMKRVI